MLACIAFLLAASPRFLISFPKERSATALDGRLSLMLSTDPSAEPRMQINDTSNTQMIFGIDVEALKPGQTATIDASALGYPVRSLSAVKPGEYYVQALLHRYETFNARMATSSSCPSIAARDSTGLLLRGICIASPSN